MKAAVLYQPKTPLKIEDVDLAEPGPGEVLVKMMASGVCHSDWHVIKGDWGMVPLPAILGHEGAGIVEAVGAQVKGVKKGDHVILSWKTSCGLCEACQQGWPQVCERSPMPSSKPTLRGTGKKVSPMASLGTFGEYAVVPEVAAIPIDKDIPFAQAALVGCGVTTGVGAAINTAKVQPGSTCAVFGAGGVGLNVIQGCRIAGATQIIAVDLLDNKLAMAKEFGATHTVNAGQGDPVAKIRELTGGAGVHYAFEAIGVASGPFLQSILCTRRRGLTVWVGHAPVNTPVTIDARALFVEKMVMGSLYGSARPHVDFPRLLRLYKSGQLRIDELITRRMHLDDVNSAFDLLAQGKVARSVLTFA